MKKAIVCAIFLSFLTLPSFADEEKKSNDPVADILKAPFDIAAGTFQAVTDTVFDLGFIRVSGGRLESGSDAESQRDSTKSSTLISQTDIESSAASSVPSLLSHQGGVTFTDEMGQGLGARIDLRGFGGEAKQALVLLDGLRAVEPFDNSVAWALYPAEYLESVRILPGGGSTVYGEGALSGVMALKTKDPGKDWHVKTENAYGSYRTSRHYAEVSGTMDSGLGILVGGRHIETDGYRQNASHDGTSTLMKTTYQAAELLKIDNSFYFVDNETGIPGPLLPVEAAANRRQKDPDGQFGDKFTDRLIQNGLWVDYYAEPVDIQITNLLGYRLRDQDSVQSFGGAFPGKSLNAIGTETFSDVVQGTRSWGEKDKRYTLFTGVEWSIDDIHNPFRFEDQTFGPFESERSIDRRMWGVFLLNRFELFERVVLEGGFRFDKIDWDIYDLRSPHLEKHKKADALSPQISVSIAATDRLTFFGGFSDAFKVPDSNTLIFETPNLFQPTPDIDASIAHHTEGGLRAKLNEQASLSATFFHVETKKEILFNDISNRNENFDTIRNGIETALEWHIGETWKGSVGHSFTDAEFDNGRFDRKEVPLVPESQWSAKVEWAPAPEWTLRFEASGVDERFALNDFNNLFQAEDYWTADLEIRRRVPHGELFVQMNNLFGEKYSAFTTSDGVSVLNLNPAPEFQVEAGVRLEI